MRVIAGEAKGRKLHAPTGRAVRPSAARMRESAFGILDHRDAIAGARVLDLFAGTGALGIEALSRGARSLVAVEQSRQAAATLRRNLQACGLMDRAEVIVQPITRVLARLGHAGGVFDLVLIDPPYRSGLVQPTLESLIALELVAPGGWVLVEHARDESVEPVGVLERTLVRHYGSTAISLLSSGHAEVEAHAFH